MAVRDFESPSSMAPHVTAGFAAAAGSQIHYLDTDPAGKATATALCLHGWMGSCGSFSPLLERLPRDVRAIAPDLPGFGCSGKPDVRYGMELYVRFVSDFASALGLDSYTLVGASMGANIAVHYLAQDGGNVRSLIMVSPFGFRRSRGGIARFAPIRPLMDTASLLATPAAVRRLLRRHAVLDPAVVTAGMVHAYSQSLGSREARRAMRRVLREIVVRTYMDDLLPFVAVPATVIVGDHDRMVQELGLAVLRSALAHAQIAVVPDCGHMPIYERPDECCRLVASSVRGRSRRVDSRSIRYPPDPGSW